MSPLFHISLILQKTCNQRRKYINMTLLSESESHSVMLDCDPMDCPWDSPGQNTGAGSLSLLQQMIPTQGSNPGLPYYRQIPYQLSHKESPKNWSR